MIDQRNGKPPSRCQECDRHGLVREYRPYGAASVRWLCEACIAEWKEEEEDDR